MVLILVNFKYLYLYIIYIFFNVHLKSSIIINVYQWYKKLSTLLLFTTINTLIIFMNIFFYVLLLTDICLSS